jgi:uncharacterized protein YqhQ
MNPKPTYTAPVELLPRMGGIALRNGLALVSDEHWAAAIRKPDGSIDVSSGRKPHLPAGKGGVPLLRGLARFAETLLVVGTVKLKMPQAELPLEGGRVALALAGAFAATETVRALGPKNALAQETGVALASFIPAVLSLKSSTISGYHGAEHKVIGGREAQMRAAAAGVPAAFTAGGPSAAASAPKEHERCGSNLVGPLLLSTIAANTLLRGKSGRLSPGAQAAATAVSLGAALEALRWSTRHGNSLVARLLMTPGRLIQKSLTTSEPTAPQLEVAQRAMKELLRLEGAEA